MARRLSQMPGVPTVPRRVLHLLRQRRQNLLQSRLCQVVRDEMRQMRIVVQQERLRDAREKQNLSHRVLQVSRLRQTTGARRRVRVARRRRPLLQRGPRRHGEVDGDGGGADRRPSRPRRREQQQHQSEQQQSQQQFHRIGMHVGFGFGERFAQGQRRRRRRRRFAQIRRRRGRRERRRRRQRGQTDAGAYRFERETIAHVAYLLRGQSASRRPHERATGRDDGSFAARHQSLVPKQTVQGQEEDHFDETTDATRKVLFTGRQKDGLRSDARHTDGGFVACTSRFPHRRSSPRGAGLPTALEGAQRFRPSRRSRSTPSTSLPATRQSDARLRPTAAIDRPNGRRRRAPPPLAARPGGRRRGRRRPGRPPLRRDDASGQHGQLRHLFGQRRIAAGQPLTPDGQLAPGPPSPGRLLGGGARQSLGRLFAFYIGIFFDYFFSAFVQGESANSWTPLRGLWGLITRGAGGAGTSGFRRFVGKNLLRFFRIFSDFFFSKLWDIFE